MADVKTGTFDWATTYVRKDGIIAGEHKVLIQCQPIDLVPREYYDPRNTPLKVESSQSPFEIKVRKPEPEPDSQ